MKGPEWKRIVKPVLTREDGWAIQGKLAYLTPVQFVLRGFLGEGSGFSRGVYLHRLRVPLFVPDDVMTLSFSKRLGHGPIAESDATELTNALRAALPSIAGEDVYLRELTDPGANVNSIRTVEVAAYASLLLGDTSRGLTYLRSAQSREIVSPWMSDVVIRCALIERILLDSDLDAVRAQLEDWTAETCRNLKIVTESS